MPQGHFCGILMGMIYFDNVSKIYPDNSVALQDISFAIEPNEFVSIVGHSGAGKTTLLKMFLAEERPTEGKIFFESTDIHRLKKNEINDFRRKVGVVFQDFRLLPYKTVYENIAFAMEAAGRTDEEIESDVPHVLDLVDLGKKIWNFPGELSGGEKQRVAIARAIVNQPDVIIADEPTGNLDPATSVGIMKLLDRINREGTTVVMATHDSGIVDQMRKRVIELDNGQVVRDQVRGVYGYTG